MTITKVGTDPQRDAARVENKDPKKEKFAKLLAEKRQDSNGAQNSGGGTPSMPFAQAVVSGREAVTGTATPRDLEQLANEIVSYLAAETTQTGHSVEIRFNARTLQGLRVHVTSEQGKVAIQFMAATPNVVRFLNGNLSSLRSALDGKGVTVSQLVVSGQA